MHRPSKFTPASVKGIALLALTLSITIAAPAAAEPGSVGTMVDIGVPDGVNGSLVYRPMRWLNLHAGAGHNTISPGVRVGATAFLLPFAVSPSVSIEGGHYFTGNANTAMVRLGLTSEDADNPLLREVGYDYANLHVGLDLGRGRVSFYLHAGLSMLRGKVRHLDEALQADADAMTDADGGQVTLEVVQDPSVTLIGPSARLGMVLFF